jgi:para-aminobenzoate synthetase component 1
MLLQHRVSINDIPKFKDQVLAYLANEEVLCYFDSNLQNRVDSYQKYDLLVASFPYENLLIPSGEAKSSAFDDLQAFVRPGEWVIGGMSYDMKNTVENLCSNQNDYFQGPELFFFKPRLVLALKDSMLTVYSDTNPEKIFECISNIEISPAQSDDLPISIESLLTKENYLDTVEQIKDHISAGDIYEMNYCQAFVGRGKLSSPANIFNKLNQIGQAPFSVYARFHHWHLMCASPERFLCKRNNKIIAQPIKGTMPRGQTPEEDIQFGEQLYNSEKDRAENVMIVDLMRNDLSRSCIPGSVLVEELFGIYRFNRVIQMISTIVGQAKPNFHSVEVIKNCFPMGSMTGAPKLRCLQLIEKHEVFKRSWFSGSFGYFDPEGDFDFNVVIRSILYNSDSNQILIPAGGAIVYDSDSENEYAETLLKAESMLQVFKS